MSHTRNLISTLKDRKLSIINKLEMDRSDITIGIGPILT